MNQIVGRAGNRFKVNVAIEFVFLAQAARYGDELLHGVVGALNDSGAEEQTFNVIPAVKIQGQGNHFLGSEARAARVAGNAIHAEDAVVHTIIGEQNFQQRDAAAVGSVTVADSDSGGISQ